MSKPKYQAVLFHPAGDNVTDFADSKEKLDVWHSINNMGSRWIFYPLCFVATDKTIVDTPDGLEHLKGKRIKTIKKYLQDCWEANKEQICQVIDDGMPLNLIY